MIGAGPAGLAAAWRLAGRGRGVRVYDVREPGGRLRTERVAGRAADAVVQLLSNHHTQVLDLVESVGATDLLVRLPGQDAVWRKGRANTLRYGSMRSMATSGALPRGLKLRLALKYVPFLERHASALDLNAPWLAGQAGLDDETIAQWGRRELGDDFVEYMAYPLLAAYYGVTPEEVGAGVFHCLARAGLRVQLLGVRGGLAALAGAVGEWLDSRGVVVVSGAPVDGLEPSGTGVRVRVAGGYADHEAVVVAVPAADAARLVPGAPWLSRVPCRSTATLVLATEGPVGKGWFGLSIPRRDPLGGQVASVYVQEEKRVDGVGPAVVVVPSPAAAERWSEGDPGAALEAALPVLDVVLPETRGRVVEARLVRLRQSLFVPGPGHFERMERARAAEVPPGVALAGDYLVAPTVEGAVRSGIQAADRLMAGPA